MAIAAVDTNSQGNPSTTPMRDFIISLNLFSYREPMYDGENHCHLTALVSLPLVSPPIW